MTHVQTPETAPKKSRKWMLLGVPVVLVIAAVALGGGGEETAAKGSEAAPAKSEAGVLPVAEYTAPVKTMDPLTEDGTYLVGEEITPGQYRVTPDEGAWVSHWTRCADITCSPSGTGGVLGSILDNGIVTGPSFLTIEPTDVAVELNGVTLTPMG